MDKNQAMVNFLQTCPTIQNNPLFFNFGQIRNNAHQISINSDDVSLNQTYVDGSVLKQYTFNLDSFKSVAVNSVIAGRVDENVDDLADVQSVLEWVQEQSDNSNYPDFGEDCIIDTMYPTTNKPQLISLQEDSTPNMAVYRITIQIEYLDISKRIWK